MRYGSETEGASTSPSINPAQIAPYYLLALEYIHPSLQPTSSLGEIFAALKQRRAALLTRPSAEVRAELEKLDETTLFIQRSHRDHPDVPEAAQHLAALRQQRTRPAAEAAPSARLTLSTPPSRLGVVEGATVRAPQPDYVAEEAPRRQAQPAASLPPGYVRGVRSGGSTSPAAATAPAPSARQTAQPAPLPEQQVLPVAWGLTLILWQGVLALGTGLTVTRLLYWPSREPDGPSLWAQSGLLFLGLALALATGAVVAAYRRATHRLALLVHLSAIVFLGYLTAWTRAAADSSRLLEPPGALWWILSALCWLGLGIAVYLRDQRYATLPLTLPPRGSSGKP